MTSVSITHLIYLPGSNLWISAIKTANGWLFRNGHDAALYLLG